MQWEQVLVAQVQWALVSVEQANLELVWAARVQPVDL